MCLPVDPCIDGQLEAVSRQRQRRQVAQLHRARGETPLQVVLDDVGQGIDRVDMPVDLAVAIA
ncbi:hypothetical protein D3C86_2261850 [compost metagenome]